MIMYNELIPKITENATENPAYFGCNEADPVSMRNIVDSQLLVERGIRKEKN